MIGFVEDYMREQMAKHRLESVDAGPVRMFWLKQPDSRLYQYLCESAPSFRAEVNRIGRLF